MVQNTSRASPGSFSGARSTIAEKSQRSRGSMGLAMGSLFTGASFYQHTPNSTRHPEVRAKRASKDAARSRRRDPLRRSPRLSCASLRKVLNRTPVALHKRFLLGAAPTLQPAFRRDRVNDPIEMLGPDELHRPTRRGVSAVVSGIVRGYALRRVVSCRRADVVRPVSA